MSDNWRSEEPRFVGVAGDQVGDSASSLGEGPGIFKEQLTAAATVEKLTFALLDRIFQGCPSLLEDIKKMMKQQVSCNIFYALFVFYQDLNAFRARAYSQTQQSTEGGYEIQEEDFRIIAQDWQNWGNSNIADYTEPSSERVVRTNYADFDERVVAPGQSRATDYSVNSEESGYSSLKDKKLGSDWGDEEKEEDKMKEEEVMLKELVRIAKEEEKAMEKLKKAAEEQQQRVEEAQRAHKSILAIEEACKRQQLDSEEKERTQSSGFKEKKLEDQSLRKRIDEKRRATKRQEEKMLKLKEADEKKKLQTRKEKLEKVERRKRAVERSQRRGRGDDVGETVGRKEESKMELKVEMNRKTPSPSETCPGGQSESAHQLNALVENDDPKKSNEEGNRGKANPSELITNITTTYHEGILEKEGVHMETNQTNNQKEAGRSQQYRGIAQISQRHHG